VRLANHRPDSLRLGRQLRPAVLAVLTLSVLAGGVFPLLLFGIATPLFPHQTGGSLVLVHGEIIGSELIGQDFTRPEWFQPRPSAAGKGYDATASGGTNLAPDNPKLKEGAPGFAGVRALAQEYRRRNGLSSDTPLPIDAVTRSASGLDPDISPENALLQVARVARARGLEELAVRRLVAAHIKRPALGVFGEPHVCVLQLNLALDRLAMSAQAR
jgi:potassium-transporting ATPase KdpC subunit